MLRATIYGLMLALVTTVFSVHAAEKFVLDEQHSYVLWKIGHL